MSPSNSRRRVRRSPPSQEVVGSEGGSAPMLPPKDYDKAPKEEDVDREPQPQTPEHEPSTRPKSQ
jgi:hypothetical protein